MLILLPPSETKRDGGDGGPLDFGALGYAKLNARRRPLVRTLRTLARDADATMAALRLGPRQLAEVDRNRSLTVSPTMPALDRYTGVLFDALDAESLTGEERRFAAAHVAVHSALFGLVGALDPIPAYRLSHDSRLPDVRLRQHWAGPVARVLEGTPGPVLDLRSEGYAALGPAPVRGDSVFVRVVAEDGDGRKRALNHFNKSAKGAFTRAVIRNGEAFRSVDDIIDWAAGAGVRLGRGAPRELELVVDQVLSS